MDKAAKEILDILDQGFYYIGQNKIKLDKQLKKAVNGTRLLDPNALETLAKLVVHRNSRALPLISVVNNKTQDAAYKLVVQERVDNLALLNFASGRNIGGGFLSGSKAQEEDLCRCSGLFRCLETQPDYYAANKKSSTLYTDHIIYSPDVPWFKTSSGFISPPYRASVITSPAPNAAASKESAFFGGSGRLEKAAKVREVLSRRAGYILALADAFSHRNLLLGAWGCGVFGNDPKDVAEAFMGHLLSPRFAGAFDSVEFAVYDPKGEGNLDIFTKVIEDRLAKVE